MEPKSFRVAALAVLLIFWTAPGDTQTALRSRIAGPIDDANVSIVRGTAHPLAQARFDRGRTPIDRVIQAAITFRLSAAQQSDLDQLLREQQDLSSPNYHRWLTPDQYASRFGMSQNDLAKVTAWLRSQGLTVDGISRDRNEISFSGTVGQVEHALKTELHDYSIKGEQHFANTTEVALPAAFSAQVVGVRGLTNFSPKPRARRLSPRFTSSISGNHFLMPGDFATIYDLNPLYSQGLDGAGQTIAVIGQTTISLSDIDAFRAASGLAKFDPTVQLVPNTGAATNCPNDEKEADLDVEWAGGVAKNASIIYVFAGVGTGACGNSRTKDAFDALQYAITNDVAPVISISYGNCEANLPTSFINTMRQWAQQANSHGQTISGPSGDDGAADCDNDVSSATNGLAVDVPASIPEVTGVGGTEFTGDATQCPGTPPTCPAGGSPADPPYWGGSSSLTSGASALMYIPEKTWNDTAQSLVQTVPTFSSSGGGASTIFTKAQTPWQTGPGVPADGKRDVPDIALNASPFHDPYLFCNAGSCVNGFRDANNGISAVGGTSAGAPAFAGILAIINQATQAASGQSNVNPVLYSLAVSKPSAFNDTMSGNNKVPCTTGTPNCPSGASPIGFTAGANYDQVTGLGSPDAFNLVTAWPGFSNTQVFAIGASPLAITSRAGQSGSAQVVAGASNGFTGNVALSCDVGTAASAQVSCTISPSSISLGGGTTNGAATLTIHTAAASAAMSRSSFTVVAFSLVIPGIFLLAAPTARSRRVMLRLLSVGLIAAFVGCGGGSGGGGSNNPGTPAGTYAITVTGTAGATSHTANISFTVQ